MFTRADSKQALQPTSLLECELLNTPLVLVTAISTARAKKSGLAVMVTAIDEALTIVRHTRTENNKVLIT